MNSSKNSIRWFDEVFENEELGNSLVKLKDEFDNLIQNETIYENRVSKQSRTNSNNDNKVETPVIKQPINTNMYSFMHSSSRSNKKSHLKPGKLNKAKSFSRFFYHSTNNLSNKKILQSNNSLESNKSSPFLFNRNRRGSTRSMMMTSQYMTSQLPKPVECIEVEIDDHWCVPPVKVDGENVTKFQYLSLHDINKLFNDENVEKPKKKPSMLRQKSRDFSNAILKLVRKKHTGEDLKEQKSSLRDLYNSTFNIETVKDLDSKHQQKRKIKMY